MRLTVVILFIVLVLSLFALALVQSAGAVQPELSTTSTPVLGNSYDPAGYGLPSTMAGYKTFAVLTSENTACRMPEKKRLVLQAMAPNLQAEPGVVRFTFSPDGNVIVCACKERLVAWNASDGQSLGTIAPNDPSIYSLAFSTDGKRLALGTRDGKIKILNWATPMRTPPMVIVSRHALVTQVSP